MAHPRPRARGARGGGASSPHSRSRSGSEPATARTGSTTAPAHSSTASAHAAAAPSGPLRSHPAARTGPGAGMRKRDPRATLGAPTDPMQLLASPSRGLDAALTTDDGKRLTLMDASTQDDMLAYVGARLRSHGQRHPSTATTKEAVRLLLSPSDERLLPPQAVDSLEQIGLLLRKLRESYTASRRAFCELSLTEDAALVDESVVRTYLLSIFVSLLVWNVPMLHTSVQSLLDLLLPVLHADGPLLSGPSQEQFQTDLRHMLGLTVPLDGRDIPLDSPAQLVDWAASLKILLDAVSLVSTSTGALGRQGKASRAEQLQTFVFWKGKLTKPVWVSAIEPVARAIRSRNPLVLRAHVRAHPFGASLAHACLAHHAMGPLRSGAWSVLQRAYVTVPLPRRVVGHPSRGTSWLDQVLLAEPDVSPDSLTAFLQSHVPSASATGPGTAALPAAVMKTLPSTMAVWNAQHRLSILRVGHATHLAPEQWTHEEAEQVASLRIR